MVATFHPDLFVVFATLLESGLRALAQLLEVNGWELSLRSALGIGGLCRYIYIYIICVCAALV